MELCSGKDLFSKIIHDGKISEIKVADIILKILGAIFLLLFLILFNYFY